MSKGRSVMPCRTSVPNTTQNAVKTMRSRAGNPAGKASAVANVTMPRMPHQERTTAPLNVGRISPRRFRNPKKWFFRRTTVLNVITQAMRTTMQAPSTLPASRT